MNKNLVAKTPPMGWNSWDCYGASVTEEELRGNAAYIAQHMKAFGWEYVVCDIQWYEPNATHSSYSPFVPLDMDEYGRLIPAVNRFPSAANGQGFQPIADYIHGLGLKFGIHMMRGIPRQAVHAATPIKGCSATAREIAHPFSLCSWNTDMYGVNPHAYGAQQYYNSIFELYASWGVDFVKVDDICVTAFQPHNLYSAKEEIELIHHAIEHCGRDMVLSLSPGPAIREQAEHLCANANMWRITDDFWDLWPHLVHMFDRCNAWADIVREGCWPDCDMLPLGHIGIRSVEHGMTDRWTHFTKEEQRTMMTLWCMFRSPLMVGAELRDNDEWTLSLLTNPEVLRLLKHSFGARQIARSGSHIIWSSKDEDGSRYVALFNLGTIPSHIECTLETLNLRGSYQVRDLWERKESAETDIGIHVVLPPHGAALYKLTEQK